MDVAVAEVANGADNMNDREAQSAANADVAVSAGHSDDEIALEILNEAERYWFSVLIELGISAAIFLTLLLCLGLPAHLTNGVDLAIAESTAVGALAALATIVVALQVAVRSAFMEPTSDAVAAIVARQRGLELFARVCSVMAFVAAGAGALGARAPKEPLHLGAMGGLIFGALLISGLAADASIASRRRWSRSLRAANAKELVVGYQNGIRWIEQSSRPSTPTVVAFRVVLLFGPVPTGAAGVLAPYGSVPYWVIWLTVALIVTLLWAMTAFARLALLTRQYPLLVVVALSVAAALLLLVATVAVAMPGFSPVAIGAISLLIFGAGCVGGVIESTRLGQWRGSSATVLLGYMRYRRRAVSTPADLGGGWVEVARGWGSWVVPVLALPTIFRQLRSVRSELYIATAPTAAERIARRSLEGFSRDRLTDEETAWRRAATRAMVALTSWFAVLVLIAWIAVELT